MFPVSFPQFLQFILYHCFEISFGLIESHLVSFGLNFEALSLRYAT